MDQSNAAHTGGCPRATGRCLPGPPAGQRGEGAAALRARREPAPDELGADDAPFWAAVRSLPRRQAHAVALHYLDDLAVAAVAKVLGLSEGAVKVHLHRGRQALAVRLGSEGAR